MEGKDGRTAASIRRFLGTTRGRILVLLCRSRQTVSELAEQLGLTDNAVRAQLHRLQRHGLARSAGLRPGVRKPHVEYELTARARELFPRAYEPVLRNLIAVISDRLPRRISKDLLHRAARSLLDEHVAKLPGRNPRRRLAALMGMLNGSGLGLEVVEGTRTTTLRSCSCPIASVTSSHPELCDVFAKTIGELLRADVLQRCERGESPQCCFEISSRAAK